MRTIRLTSAKRTCYLTAAFLTILSLQLVGAVEKRIQVRTERETDALTPPPAPVSEVLRLVQEMKRAHALDRGENGAAAPSATIVIVNPAVEDGSAAGLVPQSRRFR